MSFIFAIFLSLISAASAQQESFPKKFKGLCKEVGSNRKQKSDIGIDFKEFPNAVSLIQPKDGLVQRAVLNEPTRTSPFQDRYVILENASEGEQTQFRLRYYGVLHAGEPYFYDMSVNYSLDKTEKLATHQLQTTYYQGKVTTMNEWICNYDRY